MLREAKNGQFVPLAEGKPTASRFYPRLAWELRQAGMGFPCTEFFSRRVLHLFFASPVEAHLDEAWFMEVLSMNSSTLGIFRKTIASPVSA